jgi:hypothetical protein
VTRVFSPNTLEKILSNTFIYTLAKQGLKAISGLALIRLIES